MSLLGVDVGSSATKVVAFAVDGTALASARADVEAVHARPGWWEVDAEAALAATLDAIRAVAASDALRRDPPTALAISASGRELVPVDAAGAILGPCLRTADSRAAVHRAARGEQTPWRAEDWIGACGHVPDHMDPLNRVLWWREHLPEVHARADRYLGWHELMTERLCGRAVIDRSLAGKFFAYDLARGDWSSAQLAAFDLDQRLLPPIADWGTAVGTIEAAVADPLGLPAGIVVGVGALDTSCAAVGTGACRTGVAGLAVGSWESFVMPTAAAPPARALAAATLSVGPHPGANGLGVWSLSPNGTVVVERIRALLGLSLDELGAELERCGPEPSPVIAVPHLSGATSPWRDAGRSEGAVVGMSLATTRSDLARAFLEGIALDLALTLERLREAGAAAELVRVTGGGAQSSFWMQLKADLTGLPFEVVAEPEAGALGAAILAGLADGTYPSLEQAVDAIDVEVRRYEPDAARGARYAGRRAEYAALVEALLPHVAGRAR